MKILLARVLHYLSLSLVLSPLLVPTASAQTRLEVVHLPAATLPGASSTHSGAPLWGHIGKPDGEGPFPAIVMLHGCGGILKSHFDWAKHLNEAGFVTLVLDSFRPRSIIRQCAGGSAAASPAGRALDAYGGLQFLSEQPFVDPGRIGLAGWSHGAISAMDAVASNGLESRFEIEFQAALAFYPYCNPARTYGVPVTIFIGASDDWTPAGDCQKLAANTRGKPFEVELIIYPEAFHGFDNPDHGKGFYLPGAFGNRHWLQYDAKAHADTKRRIVAFFQDHL